MRISDWSSDVCSSDLDDAGPADLAWEWLRRDPDYRKLADRSALPGHDTAILDPAPAQCTALWGCLNMPDAERRCTDASLLWSAEVDRSVLRSEEHTSELQSLMRISYAVF